MILEAMPDNWAAFLYLLPDNGRVRLLTRNVSHVRVGGVGRSGVTPTWTQAAGGRDARWRSR